MPWPGLVSSVRGPHRSPAATGNSISRDRRRLTGPHPYLSFPARPVAATKLGIRLAARYQRSAISCQLLNFDEVLARVQLTSPQFLCGIAAPAPEAAADSAQ